MNGLRQLTENFNALESRERKMLTLGMLVVVIFIIYGLIYKPMNGAINRLQSSNQSNQELLLWMSKSVASIKGTSASGSKVDKRRGRSMNVIINTTASSAKITISRSQPRDNNQYQIWIDQVAFNEMLVWLNQLQQDYKINVSNINIGTTESRGQVRVNLTFLDSGS